MAQCFARFGSHTTVVTRSDRIMDKEDTIAAAIVRAQMDRDGVTFVTAAALQRVEKATGAHHWHVTGTEVPRQTAD